MNVAYYRKANFKDTHKSSKYFSTRIYPLILRNCCMRHLAFHLLRIFASIALDSTNKASLEPRCYVTLSWGFPLFTKLHQREETESFKKRKKHFFSITHSLRIKPHSNFMISFSHISHAFASNWVILLAQEPLSSYTMGTRCPGYIYLYLMTSKRKIDRVFL